MRLSPLPINDWRKESLSPPARISASPLSCALSKTSRAPALDLRAKVDGRALELQARRSRSAEQQRRRLRSEIEANADASGRRRRARFERVPDRCFSWTQQYAELGRRIGTGQQPEIDGGRNVELEREFLRDLRLNDDTRQLAVFTLQFHQRERGFQVLVGDRDVVEGHLQEPGGFVQSVIGRRDMRPPANRRRAR